MKQFLLHGQMFEYNCLFAAAAISREETIAVTIFFHRQGETMAADMPNYSDVVDNVNYMSLGCLGTGATISQYQDKMKLANDEECEIKVLRGPTMEAGEITDPKEIKEMIYKLGDNVTFFSFTMKEFETMVKKTGGTIKRLSGDVRSARGWQQTIGLPTLQDSANQLMWHVSKNHSAVCDNFIVVATVFQQYNVFSHVAMRKCNVFQRGYSLSMFQILAGHNYRLTKQELDNTAVLYYKGYNVLQLAQRWTWANGYVWAYSMPINVNNAMDAHDKNNENPVLTALSQGVHNGGNHALREFPKTIRARVVEYYVNTNSALLPSNLLPEENLGHPDHVQHVMTRNNLVDGEQEEQQDETQDGDQDGGNGDDNDGDDAMVGKKRKVDN